MHFFCHGEILTHGDCSLYSREAPGERKIGQGVFSRTEKSLHIEYRITKQIQMAVGVVNLLVLE